MTNEGNDQPRRRSTDLLDYRLAELEREVIRNRTRIEHVERDHMQMNATMWTRQQHDAYEEGLRRDRRATSSLFIPAIVAIFASLPGWVALLIHSA